MMKISAYIIFFYLLIITPRLVHRLGVHRFIASLVRICFKLRNKYVTIIYFDKYFSIFFFKYVYIFKMSIIVNYKF